LNPVSLPTASLERAPDGTPFSSEYQDVYHSAQGGLAQARYVFLGGNALPERWRGRDTFVVLETGFGLGLNFLATWDAWRADPARCRRLHFVSVESRPFARQELAQAHAGEHELAPLARQLVDAWPPPVAGFHRLHFEGGNVILTLLLGDARALLPQLEARADALFLDGFAPARNPGIWSPDVVRELARLAAPGATVATWTVAGGVRTALGDAGFRLEKRPGFGVKREMLAGVRAGEATTKARHRHVAIVGGGLAGTLAAERLAARDWDVDLVDARGTRSAAATGLVRPIANLRDALNAQLSRAAFLYALRHYAALDGLGWNPCGVLQLAEDDDELARFEAIASGQGYPRELLEHVDAGRARELCGRAVRGGGWWFAKGAVVAPASLAEASLARSGTRLRRLTGRSVDRIEREGADWRALDADGRVIAQAPSLVIANAVDAKRLLPGARLALASVRGQVSYLPADPARPLDVVVSGTGYVAPIRGGGHCVGASYGHEDAGEDVRADDHGANLARAESMLPGFTQGIDARTLDGWAGHRTTVPDRLPIFGATAIDGVYAATGLGSRGLLWAPLGAEVLACAMEGEPLPLPRPLAGAISPLRFLS
jgi:tRNA 5-methylaminomethyl-2-thiouridine biosynthesis bifunctional protein